MLTHLICARNVRAAMSQRKKNKPRKGYAYPEPNPKKGFWVRLKSIFYKALAVLGVIATLLGIVSVYFDLGPKVKIDKGDPYIPLQPFSAKFLLTNESVYDLKEVVMTCEILNARTNIRTPFENIFSGLKSGEHDSGNIGTLARNKPHEGHCPIFWQDSNTNFLDVAVTLKFRAFWGLYATQTSQVLRAEKDSDGKFRWSLKAESSLRPGTENRPPQLRP